jgi:hypothetical protein
MKAHWTEEQIKRCLDTCFDEEGRACRECAAANMRPPPSGYREECSLSESEERMRAKLYGPEVKGHKKIDTRTKKYKQQWLKQAVEDLCDPLYEDLRRVQYEDKRKKDKEA